MGKNAVEKYELDDMTFVTLRFKGVNDIEILKVDIELLLESLGEEGVIVDIDD